MIPVSVYIFCSLLAIFFLWVSYKSNLDSALNTNKGTHGIQELRLKVMLRIASMIFVCAVVLGVVFGLVLLGDKSLQEFLKVDPMGLFFLLVWVSTLCGCRIAGMSF